jgi:hypothetical protein
MTYKNWELRYFKEVSRMRKIVFLICSAAMILSAGCGQFDKKGDVSERAYPAKVDNANVQEFNSKLGAIKDQSSAEDAVNCFVGYVDTRLTKSGTSLQSLSSVISGEAIKKIARKEAAIRGVAESVMSADESENDLLDIGTITDNINQLGSDNGVRVDDDTVTAAKTIVEESIPNINPEKSSGITPLEAMVVGYALVSGDDGTASAETVSIPADSASTFVENIVQ